MLRKSLFFALFVVLAFMGLVYAQTDQTQSETFTITTYYPSPHGFYNELNTNKFAVGDTNENGGLDTADQPPANGQIYTARSVIFKPQNDLAAIKTLPNPQLGELTYAASEDKWYYYNGAWVTQAGGGTYYYVKHNNSTSTCPTCPTGWTREDCLGVWGFCVADDSAVGTYFSPGSGCPQTSHRGRYNIGQAALCRAAASGKYCYVKHNNSTSTCPTCPTGWTREDCLGVWGFCVCNYEVANGVAIYFPPGGNCPVDYGSPPGWLRDDIGQAALCCKE